MIIRDAKPAAPPSKARLEMQKKIAALTYKLDGKNEEPTKVEPTELEKYEEIIGRGRQSFIEVGEALAQVRDKKLYLEKGYETWVEYYERRWNFKKSHVYRLIEASEEALKLPESERPKTEFGMRKVLSERRFSPPGEKNTKHKSVIKPKEIVLEPVITDEDIAAELLVEIERRIRAKKKNLKLLRALDEWLDKSGF